MAGPKRMQSEIPAKFQGKRILVYRNGDEYFDGRRLVVSGRQFPTIDSLCRELTEKLEPTFGAVHRLHTPEGGSLVSSIEAVENGASYVAAGSAPFKRIPGGLYMLSGSPLVRRDQLTDGGYYVGVPQGQSFKKGNYNTAATPSSTSPTRKHSIVSHFSRRSSMQPINEAQAEEEETETNLEEPAIPWLFPLPYDRNYYADEKSEKKRSILSTADRSSSLFKARETEADDAAEVPNSTKMQVELDFENLDPEVEELAAEA
ncbi:unnamed protein product [Darwinula stevensoni]|uniref:Doublecortin domain-containing protein n=1 Tax=Darwinula stevensoni TaxID=69355 RepID=A0A7R9A4N9_9CRUS|nr:unnamed protein product [Darwinula stevensoni]CAG0883776.1 unnamed protein product [Darwinula stevensoni]